MRELTSYSLAELEERTGFARRIIAFYVQQGLLPKVGRRGPRTRYPESFLHRLQLIAGIRDLQDRGQLPSATLAEIRQALDQLGPKELRRLIHDGIPAAEVADLLARPPVLSASQQVLSPPASPVVPAAQPAAAGLTVSPAPELPAQRRSYGLADAGIRARPPGAPVAPPAKPGQVSATAAGSLQPALPGASPAETAASGEEAPLGELLRQLELMATISRQQAGPGAAEQWTQIPITGRIYLSIRGLAPDSAPLAEAAGRLLRRALRERGGPTR
jgi:DNA-binding transcriptional MerR regulator